MIDIWLIFSQVIPFVEVLLYTIREVVDTRLTNLKKKKGVIFIFYFLFFYTYFEKM